MAERLTRRRDRQRAGLALACLASAAGLHGLALALADGASAALPPVRHEAAATRQRSLVLLPPRPPQPAQPAQSLADLPAAAATAAALIEPVIAARRGTAPAPVEPALSMRLARGDRGEQAVRFYRLSEVEAAAEPEDDWHLDLGALDALGLDRLAFELLIDDRGRIVACRLLLLPDLADDQRRDLEARLTGTPMRPAVRAGLRVASVRRVELYADVSGGT